MDALIEAIAWTLIHSLWQISAIAALLWCVLRCLPSGSPRSRYAAATLGLLVAVAVSSSTGWSEWRRASAVTPEIEAEPVRPVKVIESTGPVAAPLPIAEPLEPIGNSDYASPVDAIVPVQVSAAEPISTPVAWLPWVVTIWAIGVVLFSLRFLRSWFGLTRIRRRAEPFADRTVQAVFSRLAESLGLRRPVALLASAEELVPMVMGWLRPAVVVPASLCTRLPAWQVEAILAHELAHIRRNDYLVNLLQNFVETAFFYHPLSWWISAQMRREREHCCDDIAADHCGGALGYARALAALEELRIVSPAGATSADGGSLLARISRLLGAPVPRPRLVISWPIGLALSLSAMFFCLVVSQPILDAAPDEDEEEQFKRTEVAEKEYTEGTPLGDEHKELRWSKPNKVGLRLAHPPFAKDATYQLGAPDSAVPGHASIAIKHLYVHNSSKEEIKLSLSGLHNRSFSATLGRPGGSGIKANEFIMPGVPKRFRLAPGQVAKVDINFLQRFPAEPGKYQLILTCGVGRCYDGSFEEKMLPKLFHGWLPGKDEWVGTLISYSAQVTITKAAPASTHVAKPGDFNNWHFDRGIEIRFVNGKITLAGHDQRPGKMTHITPPLDEWLSKDPNGDYKVAWQGRAKSGFWAVDGKSIYHFKIVPADPPMGGRDNRFVRHRFKQIGKWQMYESARILGGMPDAIRKALDLPAAEGVLGLAPGFKNKRIEIRSAGDYKLNDQISATVKSFDGLEGHQRNLLQVHVKNEGGEIITGTCALPFGTDTWALHLSDSAKAPDIALVTILTNWGAMQFQCLNHQPLDPGFSGPHAYWQATAKQISEGRAGQFTDPFIFDWARENIGKLRREDRKFSLPHFAVRLVAEEDEEPEIIRPTYWQRDGGYQRHGNFVPLGEVLLEQGEAGTTGLVWGGVARTMIGVAEPSQEKFNAFCKKYEGRKAAILWRGMVTGSFVLKKGITTFSCMRANPVAVPKYAGRSIAEWDEMLVRVSKEDREALKALGWGSKETEIPEEAIPMLLGLVKTGQGATKCRVLGALNKLEKPSNQVLNSYLGALSDPSSGIRSRAGYTIGKYPERADYLLPHLLQMLNHGTVESRGAAVFAIGRLGLAARATLPTLKALPDYNNDAYAEKIAEAIAAIETAPDPTKE